MQSALRLFRACPMKRDEDWIGGRRYFDGPDYRENQGTARKTQDAVANPNTRGSMHTRVPRPDFRAMAWKNRLRRPSYSDRANPGMVCAKGVG